MSLDAEKVKQIAHLARLGIAEQDIALYAQNLSGILDFVAQMSEVDTQGITPMAHPLEAPQRLRQDEITEPDARELFQKNAPAVDSGLYLVPQVIE